MKVWALLVALVAAEQSGLLRGSSEAPVVVVHHRRPHLNLLAKSSHHHTKHHDTVVRGVDMTSLAGGDVANTGIIEGSGGFPDEAGAAKPAEPLAPKEVVPAATADANDAASVVFGGDAGEAPTREELKVVHAHAAAAAVQKPAAPYHVTLDLAPPPPITIPSAAAAPATPPIAAIHQQAHVERVVQQESAVQQQATQEAVVQQAIMEQAAHQQVTAESSAKGSTPTGITRPKGWDQCLKFSRFVKSQGVSGMELVKTWKATCEPAVSSGVATERYKVMCNALGGTVEPFAAQQDYDVEKLCDAVLAVFHDVTAVDVKASS